MKEDIKEILLNNIDKTDQFDDSHELYENLDYDGSVHEIVDSNIDIYFYDLREWCVNNYDYIDRALRDGFCDGVTDFHKLIQIGQYVQLEQHSRNMVAELFEEYNGKLFNVMEVT
nr:hypothetical protein [uncultured Mediterranean phage uvMED]